MWGCKLAAASLWLRLSERCQQLVNAPLFARLAREDDDGDELIHV